LASALSFPDQVRNWLETMHFQCEVEKDSNVFFTTVTASLGERSPFCLILVGLYDWRNSGASESEAQKILDAMLRERQKSVITVVLWEDYWLTRKPIVISRLTAMQGFGVKIPARLTQVRRTDNAQTNAFLDKNHLNGPTSSKFRYGLYLPRRYYRILPEDFQFDQSVEELLVAVATFSNARIFTQQNASFRSHELIRFASLLHTNVVGAFDKLLHAFIREKQPDDIMTYADREWSEGASYVKLGFERRDVSPPSKVFLDTTDLSRHTIKRHASMSLESADISPVEYLTVYNMGSIKFVRTIKHFENEY
jgi:hypothetical protein